MFIYLTYPEFWRGILFGWLAGGFFGALAMRNWYEHHVIHRLRRRLKKLERDSPHAPGPFEQPKVRRLRWWA